MSSGQPTTGGEERVRDLLSSADVETLRQQLETQIEGDVRFDAVYRGMHATDASVYQIMPAAVVRPRHAEDVAAVLSFCRDHGHSITARGGGTSQAGQAIGPGLQLDFSKHLNGILEIQPDRQRVRVQPGIVLDELNAALRPYGLVLPLLAFAGFFWFPLLVAVVAAYAISYVKTAQGLRKSGMAPRAALHQAVFLSLSKFPNLIGMLTYRLRKRRGAAMRIIEYK